MKYNDDDFHSKDEEKSRPIYDDGGKKLFIILISMHLLFFLIVGTLYILTFFGPYKDQVSKLILLVIG